MKANPLVIALAVLVVLGGAVWYTNENPPPSDDEEKPTLIETEPEEIAEIVIRRPSGETIRMIRGEDGWSFGDGIDVRADSAAVGLMATNLGGMQADRLVEENVTDWSPYGLASTGDLAVKMTPKEGPPVEIVFGNETPTGSGVFARIEGDPRLFTVYNYVKTGFEKELFDLRDKNLVKVDQTTIERVKVKTAATQFALEREEGKWSIAEPGPYRADEFTAGDLARSIQNAEMTEVLAEGEGVDEYSFARPYAEVEIVDSAGAHTLTIGKSGDEYYAKSSDQPGVYAVSGTLAEGLDKSLDELRNKKLLDFGFDPVSKIEMRDGDLTAVIEKRDADWVLTSDGDRKLDAEKVQTLIDRLRNLAAAELLPPRDVGAVSIEATVTADGGAETIRLGPFGDSVNAVRDGESTIYKLEKGPAEDLRQALRDVLAEPEPEPEASEAN